MNKLRASSSTLEVWRSWTKKEIKGFVTQLLEFCYYLLEPQLERSSFCQQGYVINEQLVKFPRFSNDFKFNKMTAFSQVQFYLVPYFSH